MTPTKPMAARMSKLTSVPQRMPGTADVIVPGVGAAKSRPRVGNCRKMAMATAPL